MGKRIRSCSAPTREALRIMGDLIRATRIQRRMPAQDLAERVGISRGTLKRIEDGDPGCEIGLVFETATILSIHLYGNDNERHLIRENLQSVLRLLPASARHVDLDVNNDF